MDGTANDMARMLGAMPVPTLAVRDGQVVCANVAAEALLGIRLRAPTPVADLLGAGFDMDGASPWRCDVVVDRRSLHVEVAVGPSFSAGGERLVLLRDVSREAETRQRLERGLAFERLLTRGSAELMRSPGDRLDAAIVEVLGAVGRFFGVDRAYVFLIDDDAATQSNTHEWVAPGISHEAHNLQDVPLDTFPWLLTQLRNDSVFRFECIADLPGEACNERAEFEREGIQSILIVPLWAGGALRGFAGFDAVRSRVEWGEPYVIGLRLLAQMLAGAIDARAMARRLRRQAMHDAVTGLPNRLYLRDRFEQCARHLPAAVRSAALVAVIDVDDFKVVNDRFGHACGDMLLRELGRRFEAALSSEGVVARVGGDEFVVVEPAGSERAEVFAQRILAAAREPFDVPGGHHRAAVSVGIVCGVEEGDELDTLLDRADVAMYRAKSSGKNRWALADAVDRAPLSPA